MNESIHPSFTAQVLVYKRIVYVPGIGCQSTRAGVSDSSSNGIIIVYTMLLFGPSALAARAATSTGSTGVSIDTLVALRHHSGG